MKYKYPKDDMRFLQCRAIDFMDYRNILDKAYPNHCVVKYETFISYEEDGLMVKALFIGDTTKLEEY